MKTLNSSTSHRCALFLSTVFALIFIAVHGNAQAPYAPQAEIEKATKAIAAKPNVPYPYMDRATAYTNLGDYDRALVDYNKAAQLLPKAGEILVQRGMVYYLKGNFAAAMNDVEKAIKLGLIMHEPDPYFLRGFLHLQNGDFTRAVADWKRASQLGEKTRVRSYFFDSIFTTEKVIADFSGAPADKDESLDYFWNLLSRYKKRETSYEQNYGSYALPKPFVIALASKVLQLFPPTPATDPQTRKEDDEDKAEMYYERGRRYMELQWAELGLADLSKAKQLDPEYTIDFHDYRGQAYLAKRQYDAAIADFTAAINLSSPSYGPSNKTLWSRAMAYIQTNRTGPALVDINKIISTAHDWEPVKAAALAIRHNISCSAGKKAEAAADAAALKRMGKQLAKPCQ